jgi:hypothetical protein
MRRFLVALSVPTLLTAALVGSAAAQGSGGVTDGAAFWANGQLYRTVNTPTDIGGTGAPEHSFDIIYAFPMGTQINVAEAAPGDRDYNGGRWMVTPISFTNYAMAAAMYGGANGIFDSDTEVLAAVNAGAATLGDPVRFFVCPVVKMPVGPN